MTGQSTEQSTPPVADSFFPRIFGQTVSDHLTDILDRQQSNGSILYHPKAPAVYPQQAIMPLAFCWAGLDPVGKWKLDMRLEQAIRKLGDYLYSWYDDAGGITFDSYGHQVTGVDQRLTYAWCEALRMLRDAGGDFPFDQWGDKILRACRTLMEKRLRKLQGVRRFIVRVTGTGTNHVVLYISTLYRAGQVLGQKELCDFSLPLGRAIARDVHPDGYWDEHSDVMRNGGPTPGYSYLSMAGVGLMADWTGEAVFREAADRAANFHANFCYPDGVFLDLIDERVRYDVAPRAWNTFYDSPRIWGLYAMSHTPQGRGSAIQHMRGWIHTTPVGLPINPETLARHVENYSYWNPGPIAAPPTDRRDHHARLTLPAAIYRKGPWCFGVSCIRSYSTEDDTGRDNPFTMDRQKIFSVWHERVGAIIDGSHAKSQPENSTFAAAKDQGHDFYVQGGEVGESDGDVFANAVYKTFFGAARLKVIDDSTLKITLTVDPAATNGPFTAAFTMPMLDRSISGLNGKPVPLGDSPFTMTSDELGGGFHFGSVTLTGPKGFQLNWPMSPFNCYDSNRKPKPEASVPRVSIELTPQSPTAEFTVKVK